MTRHLLLVAYHFPPAGGVPVRRVLRFLRHLPEHGWRCSVLTADVPYDPFHPEDPGGAGRLPPVERVLRAPARSGLERGLAAAWRRLARLRPSLPAASLPASSEGRGVEGGRLRRLLNDRLLFPDPKRGWATGAIAAGCQLAHVDPFDIVVATGYPWSSFHVAAAIAREVGMPYALDYRDAWTANPRGLWATPRHEALERTLVQGAALTTAATDWIRADLAERVDPSGPVVTVRNGYDLAEAPPRDPSLETPGRLLLVYTGSFNDAWPPGPADQSPWHLVQAMEGLPEDIRSTLRIRLVGRAPRALEEHLAQRGLDDVVELIGPVPHPEALQHQLAADGLIAIVSAAPGTEGILTGKLVEYVGAKKPVLAFAPPGELARAVTEHALGEVVSPTDPTQIAETVAAWHGRWREGGGLHFAPLDVGAFSAEAQIGKLAAELDRVTTAREVVEPAG